MKYSIYQHILLPVGALLAIAFMFIYYSPSNEPEIEVVSDAKRGCIASAYQATRHAASTLETNLKVCDEL